MISNKILLICLAFIALTACSAGSKKQTNHHMENEKRTLVKLETTMGNITVALYNETPKHRDNFIKLGLLYGIFSISCVLPVWQTFGLTPR